MHFLGKIQHPQFSEVSIQTWLFSSTFHCNGEAWIVRHPPHCVLNRTSTTTSITSDIHHTGLNTFCQQFGDICRLEGVCAHFGRRVREYVFSWISMCHLNMGWVGIEYSLPTIGKYVSVEYMYTLSRWQTRFFFFFWCKIVFLSLIKAWPGSFRWISPLGILSH